MALARIQTSIINKLGDLGRLTEAQVNEIKSSPDDLSGEEMENLLLGEYKINEFQILVAKSKAFDLNPFNAKNYKKNDDTFVKLDRDLCRENKVLPVGLAGDYIIIALADPFNLNVINKIQDLTKLKVSPLLALEKDIDSILEEDEEEEVVHHGEGFLDVLEALDMDINVESGDLTEADLEEESSPIVQLANRIVEDAYYSGASDIHIEPFERSTRVRVRIDGKCHEKLNLSPQVVNGLVARLKIMSNLDIAEKRLPQDGRIVFKHYTKKGIDVDLRVATAPLNHGEGVVMRILDKKKSTLPLSDLGFERENMALYQELITRPYGMILHCGPTGSGKSMTLYSALNEINSPDRCIRTAEDPIEYTLPGLLQMQMNRKIGLTFATALRAFLRQDPDIILVGEIRDKETASIATEAALTGHMLFSTLHTNDAPGTVSRLTEMDVEPFMISSSLVCVCAQRLIRRLCKTCKQSYVPEGNEAKIIKRIIQYDDDPILKANPDGCPACGSSGYKGRIGIHEVMGTSEELIKGINAEVETAELKRIAVVNGMRTLHQDSLYKVQAGTTSMEEALATVPPDLEDMETLRGEKVQKEEKDVTETKPRKPRAKSQAKESTKT